MLRCRRFLSLPLLLLLHHLLLLDLVVHAEYLVFKMLVHGVHKAHLIQGWNRVLVSLISWPGQLLSLNPCQRPKILARMLFWGFCL